jgi:hypothetical protein
MDKKGKPLGNLGEADREIEAREENGFLGHFRQSSREGCYSLRNHDHLNF